MKQDYSNLLETSSGTTATAAITSDPLFIAVRECADVLITHGRDDYGPRKSPLLAAQLNVLTRRIPAGTADDPGLWLDDPEIAGYQPYCHNLLSDFSLLDILRTLTLLTGDDRYERARVECLASSMSLCRHPHSGYLAWGEHVGYDMVRDRIHAGSFKGWHEVKAHDVPWQPLWEIDPAVTRHEIEVAFHDHLCDASTFAFNRHTPMEGGTNRGTQPCSLVSSGGVYLQAWCWLHRKTGETKFLDWAMRMNAQIRSRRDPSTGLLGTDDVPRRQEMWYLESAVYARFLLRAAAILGPQGQSLRQEALRYLLDYDRCCYDRAAKSFYATLNTQTGQPVPHRERYLQAWTITSNTLHLVTLLAAAAEVYADTGDQQAREVFDRALACVDVPGHLARGTLLPSADLAAAIFAILAVARRSGDRALLPIAGQLVDYAMRTHYRNGLFTSGLPGGERYYCARAGSAALAASVLAYALTVAQREDLAPRCRDLTGGLRN